ncbi:hypothetical protein EYZ11_011433 [Aspergillus tanneri]|uniref:Thioredoxin n=1 Tax=Aspergillus tanneri TaxID=1220188 RepID=A0A4S3J2U6_9EURO|nr:mitochondrial thioredoxin [Aspergillus tanneri]KAA8652688.1 mitochondrial thioredoxin [Aspergillus tanneri]THC89116.1 hypothetical protein EYZ11_011433 [Aspergillus tanneri]
MSVIALNSLSEFRSLINSGYTVIIDFWATWCGPCRIISPVFESLATIPEFSDIKFVKVDVDEQTEIAEDVGIRAMPTFIVFKDGVKMDELVGADHNSLRTLISRNVPARS